MDGLKQIAVVAQTMAGVNEILGLRGDGALFRGLISIDQPSGKASVLWTQFTEEVRKP